MELVPVLVIVNVILNFYNQLQTESIIILTSIPRMRKAAVADSGTRRIAGHSSREMLNQYNTSDNEDLRKAVAQMGTFPANVG